MDVSLKAFSDYLEIIISGKLVLDISEKVNTKKIKSECKKRSLKKLLINIHNLIGNLSTIDRFIIADKFAKSFSGSNIKIAVISNENFDYHVDPFFETAAINRGMNIKIFIDKEKANKWLSE